MHPEIRGLMARQDGLVTRPQVLEIGVPPETVRRFTRDGVWTVVRRGVYAEAELVRACADDPRQRRLLVDRAASLRVGAPHVPSHDFAALELDLPLLQADPELTHLTRPGIVGTHLHHGVKHHLAPYPRTQLRQVGGRMVLGPARTAIDVAREHGNPAGVVAVDGARATGTTLAELDAVLALMTSWPYVTRAREAVALSDPDSDSPGETLSRGVVTELGHGRPQTQFGLTADGRTVWCDLRLGRHVFEFDGRVKYRGAEQGGLALRSVEEVVWEEKRRQDFVCGFRLGMSRIVWSELFGAARARLRARLEREYLHTCHLFGTDIADLAAYRPRGPRPRPARGRPAA